MEIALRIEPDELVSSKPLKERKLRKVERSLLSKGLLLSILGHIALFLSVLLLQSQQKSQTPWIQEAIKAEKQKTIKSYVVFNSPKSTALSKEPVKPKSSSQEQQLEKINSISARKPETPPKPDAKPEPKVESKAEKPQIVELSSTRTAKPEIMTGSTSDKKVKPFSAYGSLKQLESQLRQEAIPQTQPNASSDASIFNPNPVLVPEQEIETPLYKRKKVAAPAGVDKVYKNMKTGMCTLEQDMSYVGFQDHKAYSSFECGESEHERNFREHMKKYGKNRKQ